VEVECRYSGYLKRQKREIESLRKAQSLLLPADFDFMALPGVSAAEKEKLVEARPATVLAASRIQGVKPSSLMVLFRHARHLEVNASQDEERLSQHAAQVGQQFVVEKPAESDMSWDTVAAAAASGGGGLMGDLRDNAAAE
jgi:hypothetical protein